MNIIKHEYLYCITTPSTPRYQSLRARLDGLKQRSETGLPQKNCVAALLETCFHPRNDRIFASRFVKTVMSDDQIGIFPKFLFVSFRGDEQIYSYVEEQANPSISRRTETGNS